MKLIWQDYIIVLAFMLFLSAGVATKMILAKIAGVEGYAEVAHELESNPTARKVVDLRFGLLALQVATIALLSSIYWLVRRQFMLKGDEASRQLVTMYAVALFFVYIQNAANDLPILLGLIG